MNILITGASSGIGLAVGIYLQKQGFSIVGTCRSPETLSKEQVKSISFPLISLDLTNPDSVEECISKTKPYFNSIDTVIHNAGYGEVRSIEDTSMDEHRSMFEVHHFGAVALTKKLLPVMRKKQSGMFINIGSLVYDLPFGFKAQYCASKAAFSAWTLALSQEVSSFNIRVHLIEPGWVRTNFHKQISYTPSDIPEYQIREQLFLDNHRDQSSLYPDGVTLAKKIHKIILNPKAPVRHTVGWDAHGTLLLKRLLPRNFILNLIQKWFRKPSP